MTKRLVDLLFTILGPRILILGSSTGDSPPTKVRMDMVAQTKDTSQKSRLESEPSTSYLESRKEVRTTPTRVKRLGLYPYYTRRIR